jgi:hypothetical protein
VAREEPRSEPWAWVDNNVQAMDCKVFDEFTAAVDATFEIIPKETLNQESGHGIVNCRPYMLRKRLQLVIDNDGAKCGYYGERPCMRSPLYVV